jgi:hypothetical protein
MSGRYRYQAFVSYSHDDQATVDWLAALLRRTWVPGRLPPRLFIDRHQMTAGDLTVELKRALADSRYLIVCVSPSVQARPRWIDLEVDEFARAHAAGGGHASPAILACRVGAAATKLPAALTRVERARRGEMYLPDLTGDPRQWSAEERTRRRLSALSLLSAILGLRDRDALLRRRTKGVLALLALLLMTGAGYALWRHWLTTPTGSFYQARRTLIARAQVTAVADTPIVHAAAAFGRLNDPTGIDGMAAFVRDKSRRATVTAAGFASLPRPDCGRVARDLRELDESAVRAWPEAPLLAVARCRAPWPAAFANAQPSLTWVSHLARAGLYDRARSMLDVLPESERFEAAATLAAYGADDVDRTTLGAWAATRTPIDRVADATSMLERLALQRRAGAGIASDLLQVGLDALDGLPVGVANVWDYRQRLAAHLAGAGRATDAARILDAHPEAPGTCPQNGGTEGLAWRALALRRLGRAGDVAAMQAAATCASTPAPVSRSWGEWRTIAVVHVLLDQWPQAFEAAERPEDERTRVLFSAELVDLWAHRP